MSISNEYFEAIADYGGVEGDTNYIAVMKGDVVRLIKKDKEWFTVEKDGHIGKVPKGILVQKSGNVSNDNMNQQEQTKQHIPEAKQSNDNQNIRQQEQPQLEQSSQNPNQYHNSNSQIKSIKPEDNQQSQIISVHSNDQIKQQSENQQQQKINLKPETEINNEKQKIIQEGDLYNKQYMQNEKEERDDKEEIKEDNNNNQIKDNYDETLLEQKMKDIHSIIESNTINDEMKGIKLKEIFNELKKKDLNELRRIFNNDAYKLIQSYINGCTKGIKKILLYIIELLSEKGIQQLNNNQFKNDFEQSGLVTKIEHLIKDKIEKEKEEKKYSAETVQLIRIHIKIMARSETNQQMNDIYTKVIENNLINLLNTINILKENNNKVINDEQRNEESESELKLSTHLIRLISLISEKDPNSLYNLIIPDQIIIVMKERIMPLIHINCPPDFNCPKCISIPQSPSIIDLKSTVFQSLFEVSFYNKEFQSMLQENNNIISHLTPSIIQFASQYQINKKIRSNESQHQQQSEQSTYPSLIKSSLILLCNLINNKDISKLMIHTPNLLHSLIQLNRYNINNHINEEKDREALIIRDRSRLCLGNIQKYGDKSTQFELVSSEYAGVQVLQVSTAGGDGEQDDGQIFNGLYNIFEFLKSLYQGRQTNYPNSGPKFPQQISLARRSDEQIEEEGGNEEVESQLINKWNNDNINDQANETKAEILNYFINKSNARPFWYEEDLHQ